MLAEVADVWLEVSVIDAEIVQGPAETKATNPDVEFTVQTPVVELVKLIVPPATDGVAVKVGGVAIIV